MGAKTEAVTLYPDMLTRQARLLSRVKGTKFYPESRSFLGGIFDKDGSKQDSKAISTEASFDWNPYKLHQLDDGPATSSTLTRDEGLRLYREMVTVRRMETAAANLYKEKSIRGFCHLCSGQEAIYSGMKAALRDQDAVITSYRAHGFTYVLGVPVLGVLAELTGRKSGCVRGKVALCTCTPRTSMEGTELLEPRCHSALASPSHRNITRMEEQPLVSTAMGRLTRARWQRPSTWRRSGISRQSSYVRITTTGWELLRTDMPPLKSSLDVEITFTAFLLMVWTCWP